MKKIGPLRLAVVGLACYVSSVLWVFAWDHFVRRNDPPGWIVDRSIPVGPWIVMGLGLAMVAAALVLGVTRYVIRRIRGLS